jgi:carboxylesterase type B
MEVAESSASIAETLHAADYAVYAYLQMRDEAAAVSILARLPALASRFDPAAVTGAAPGSAGVFALAAMPARYALERRAWADAAALLPNTSTVPYADALTHFARALGAAHLGDQPLARASVDSLAALRDRLSAQSEAYWTEQVEIQRLGASAWLELSNNRNEQALALMREAAAREDATEKAAVTPGPLAPARELLGDMLLELGRPAEALAEYRSALTREPNRYWTLEGARKAAAAAGDGEAAAEFERLLKELTGGQS